MAEGPPPSLFMASFTTSLKSSDCRRGEAAGGGTVAVDPRLHSREEREEEQDEEVKEALDDSTETLWFSFKLLLRSFFSCSKNSSGD